MPCYASLDHRRSVPYKHETATSQRTSIAGLADICGHVLIGWPRLSEVPTVTIETPGEQAGDLMDALPAELRTGNLDQTAIPRIARDDALLTSIEEVVRSLPTRHDLAVGDARDLSALATESVHLVVTSPPYWTLKQYTSSDGQLGEVEDFDEFIADLDQVWRECFRVLVPGGRVICVVGDVLLSRRQNKGRHTVVPLHAAIQLHCRDIGYDNLAPILWHKVGNADYEAGGGRFLGKPYEPGAIIKNDVEYILFQRKPGGYRSPTTAMRILSVISADNYQRWFRQVWSDISGASSRDHPAPYPEELAERLVRMFSFAGDVVLDPFLGTGTTAVAAARWGRNSIGVEIDPGYMDLAESRLQHESSDMFRQMTIERR